MTAEAADAVPVGQRQWAQAQLWQRMVDTDLALAVPSPAASREPRSDTTAHRAEAERELAHQLRTQGDWQGLADMYQKLSDQAWRQSRPVASLRLLLAELAVRLRLADGRRTLETMGLLAQRHRLRTSFTAAQVWNHRVLREELTVDTASAQARAWRELAAVHEVTASYDAGAACIVRALAVCDRFPNAPGVAVARIQALLQASVLHRLRGALDDAFASIRGARELAEQGGADAHTHGLIHLREGGLLLVVGRPAEALECYQRAERVFAETSAVNQEIARLRQVSCLRALQRSSEALVITSELAARHQADGDSYRLGQVLLEQAEVQQDCGDLPGVAETLALARPLLEESGSLESLRWHRHMARYLISVDSDPVAAAEHLCVVLDSASAAGRRDLTRTMLALHDLLRIKDLPQMSRPLSQAVSRAALVAADLQRDALRSPADRWALQAEREEVYAAAVLLHAGQDDARAVAQIIETGRADLINALLDGATVDRAIGVDKQILNRSGPDPTLLDSLFVVAQATTAALRGRLPGPVAPLPLPGSLPLPGGLPSQQELDDLADTVVLTQAGSGPAGLWVATACRPRAGQWRVLVTTPIGPDVELLASVLTGTPSPSHGISAHAWERLAALLLPDPQIWAGTADTPRTVLLSPDPRLWHLPYAAMRRDGVCLLDVAHTVLTPSLRTHVLLRQQAPDRTKPIRTTSVSLLDRTLPGHDLEAAALHAWPGGHDSIPDLNDDTGAALDRAALLYVSGHAVEPGSTARIGPTGITLDLLAGQQLPPLVLLNGCWTGTAASRYGQDPLSLALGAVLGGATTVIAGIGRIGSTASAHVASDVLRELAEGAPPLAALRRSQLALRDAHPELGPFDWAGLCLIGLPDHPL